MNALVCTEPGNFEYAEIAEPPMKAATRLSGSVILHLRNQTCTLSKEHNLFFIIRGFSVMNCREN